MSSQGFRQLLHLVRRPADKEMLEVQHLRLTIVFDRRNAKQSQELMELSWGYCIPEVTRILKCPNDEANMMQLRQMASGINTNAIMTCTHRRNLKQSSFIPTESNCSLDLTGGKRSLTHSRVMNETEQKVVRGSLAIGVVTSISEGKPLPGKRDPCITKTHSNSNRKAVSFKSSNAKRVLLLELEAMKKQDETDEQLASKKCQAENLNKQEEKDMRIPAEEFEIAKEEEENVRIKQVSSKRTELARNGTLPRPTQKQEVTKPLQSKKGPQKICGTFNEISTSTKAPTGAELRERGAHSQNVLNGVTDKKSPLKKQQRTLLWAN